MSQLIVYTMCSTSIIERAVDLYILTLVRGVNLISRRISATSRPGVAGENNSIGCANINLTYSFESFATYITFIYKMERNECRYPTVDKNKRHFHSYYTLLFCQMRISMRKIIAGLSDSWV